MTPNRAHKRAARSIAAKKNIRYPEADALANPEAVTSEAPGFDEANAEQGTLPVDLQRVRIVFARRYADMVASGLDPMRALDLLSESLDSIPGAEKIIEAIPAIRSQIGMGFPSAQAWWPYRDLLGTHLYQMLVLSESLGWSPKPFRDAADTIEAEMRLEKPKRLESTRLLAEQAERRLIKLGLPEAVQGFVQQRAGGLFLISGATGTGKTTTGEVLFRYAQATIAGPAFAIMDPAETYILAGSDATTLPVQHSDDAVPAVQTALRQSAGVIFIDAQFGQPELIEAALDAALVGTLVFATVHGQASDAAQRLLDAFPDSGSAKIRAKVQLALRGILEQVLVRRADGKGRVLAAEVWAEDGVGSDAVLSPAITIKESLEGLVEQGTIDPAAMEKAMLHRW